MQDQAIYFQLGLLYAAYCLISRRSVLSNLVLVSRATKRVHSA